MEPPDGALTAVDAAMQLWRQGDCVVGEQWFVHRIKAAGEDTDLEETRVAGFAILTQACDLVRECEKRPLVEVCPLVEVAEVKLKEIRRSQWPAYAYISGVAGRGLVADLNRVMTIEKAVVAGWVRTPGCQSDDDVRRLALALARKRARMAFPDDFVEWAGPLIERITKKHDKGSAEGQALQTLREIRVRAAPSWGADQVHVAFRFIADKVSSDMSEHVDVWLEKLAPAGRFVSVDGLATTLDDLTAREYVESDPLDVDHLSTRPA